MPRELIIISCTECKRKNYTSTKNKKKQAKRLEIKKFCKFCRKRMVHKEEK
ncbi:MAG: 50S ribosomal protein L33 [Candidatus Omnitrophica bacterium]|nr:50S ribosomal protein L33 [Candidatus Omnitrophota bacterium]MBU1933601.1 50S ribosomal protein L33 [Candidatus Omnitrophota bacterium]